MENEDVKIGNMIDRVDIGFTEVGQLFIDS